VCVSEIKGYAVCNVTQARCVLGELPAAAGLGLSCGTDDLKVVYLICSSIVSLCRRTQPHSSLMSGQCSTPSHTCALGTQPPVLHRNWSSEQSAQTNTKFCTPWIL